MMAVLKDWDPRVYNTFTQAEELDDYEAPMPIFISKELLINIYNEKLKYNSRRTF